MYAVYHGPRGLRAIASEFIGLTSQNLAPWSLRRTRLENRRTKLSSTQFRVEVDSSEIIFGARRKKSRTAICVRSVPRAVGIFARIDPQHELCRRKKFFCARDFFKPSCGRPLREWFSTCQAMNSLGDCAQSTGGHDRPHTLTAINSQKNLRGANVARRFCRTGIVLLARFARRVE